MRTTPLRALLGLMLLAFAVGCDEDRATPTPAPQPSQSAAPTGGQSGANPIKGNRSSAYGKAYDVAEDLVEKKIPDYNRRIEEELEKK